MNHPQANQNQEPAPASSKAMGSCDEYQRTTRNAEMNLSPNNLTFDAMLTAYIAVLQDQPGKALRLPDSHAVFLENGNVYGVTVSKAGELEMVTAGCISSVAWDDERGCWESDDDPEISVSAVNHPVFLDLPSTEWVEFSHCGKRWAFDSDQLAEWEENEAEFHFRLYHGLAGPTVDDVIRFIDLL